MESYTGIALLYTPIYCSYRSLEFILNMNLVSIYSSLFTAIPLMMYMKYKGIYFSTLSINDDRNSLSNELISINEKISKKEQIIKDLVMKHQSLVQDKKQDDDHLKKFQNILSNTQIELNTYQAQCLSLEKELKSMQEIHDLKIQNYEVETNHLRSEAKRHLQSMQSLESNILERQSEKNELLANVKKNDEIHNSKLTDLHYMKSKNDSLNEQINHMNMMHQLHNEKYKSQLSLLTSNIEVLQKEKADKEHHSGVLEGKIEEKDEQWKQLKSLELKLENIYDKVGVVTENVVTLVENESKIQSSSQIGLNGENFVNEILCEITTSYEHTGQNKAAKRGDFIISNFMNCQMNVMIEVKNDQNNIAGKNREKFFNDLDFVENEDIHCGLFISLLSNIANEEAYKIQLSPGGKPYLCIFNFARLYSNSSCKHVLIACLYSLMYPFSQQQQLNYVPYEGRMLEEIHSKLRLMKITNLKNQGIRIKDSIQKINDEIKAIISCIDNVHKDK